MDGTGEYFSAESGVLMTADKSQIVYCPPAKVSVDIPATVQVIGKNAFEGSNLTSLTIPANVTTIQESAFKSSASLRSLTFEGTLQDDALTIEANAFSECAKISSVTLPGNLKVLKANAFANCSILQKVIVNSGADVEFEANAFYDKLTNGSNLVELDIGPDFYCENVGAVFGGPNLATLKTDDANPNFTAINNVLYAINKADSTLAVQYFPVGNRVADLKIDERVSAIGDRVFENIITLKSVTIPATVRKIGAYAFSGCRFMETVTFEAREITETLEIGNYAFNNCAAIKVLDLPAGTTKLGDYDTSGNISDLKVFSGCSSLTAINVGEGGEYFYSKDGILYGTSVDGKKVLYTCPALCVVTSLEIPSDLNEIFDYAFAGNNSIETITFEITTVDAEQFHIGRGAFSEMGGLKTVTLPEGVEVVGEEMFKNSSIETFECPVSVTTLGVDSFYGTSNLSSFTFREGRTQGISLAPGGMIPPDWWYSEGDGEYGGTPSSPYDSRGVFILSGLPSIDLPAGSTIGKYAFAWSSLNSITIPAGTKNIAEATFAYAGLTSVTISEGVEKIDDYAFYQCSRLRSVTLPDSCKTVGWGSFSGCGLSSLDLGSVVTIGESSFANMYNLSGTLTIPNTVTYIGEGAFSQIGASKVVFEDDDEEHQRDTLALCTLGSWGGVFIFCDSLEEVVFPNMKGTIEVKQQDTYNGYGSVFFMCGAYNYETGEQSISKVTLGSGIATLEYLFSECSIGEIVGLDDNPNFYIDKETHVLYNASKTEIFQALDGFDIEDYRVPEDVTKIHSGAFQGVESLKSVYIPNSVSYIGDQAFYLCPNLTKVRFADDFNHDMTWGSSVFAGNYRVPSAVSDVVFPITITTIGDSMFRYSSVKFVSYENFPGIIDVGEYGFNGSALEYIDLSKNKGFNMGFTYYIDPSSLEELFHGREAFSNCDNLKSVILNDDIKAIAAAAFDFDFGLEEIIIPDGVIEIGMYAFRGTSLKSIVIPDSVQYLGGGGSAESPAGAFTGCSELEEVTIGTSGASDIQMIGDFSGGYTFANCTNLKKVTLYGNPMRVGLGAFNNCSNLTEFVFGEGSMIETISEAMLKDLPITSITLPDTVRRIEANAFNGCTELKEINIPDALEYIGDFAFANTAIGGEFYINGNVTNIGAGAFMGTNITDFIVDATNSLYTSDENGIIYDISDAIYAFPAGKEISELRLDSQVKSIKNYAFAGVKHIKSIFIPETVMEIGTGAFSGWTSEQSIVFEVSMEEGEFYGGGWRIGNKALKYFSNGDEFEEPGSYMVEDYDASKVPETLYTYHADDGFRIVVSRTQTTVYNAGDPEYEFSQTQISNYTFGHKGDVYMFGQATDYSSSENYYELGLDDGTYNMIYKRGDTYYRASYDASNLNVLTLISNQDFVQSLMSYTSLNEEMKKTEVEFLGRKCYKYTYVTTAETIEFIFDQETGLCLKGKTQGVSRWGNYPVYTSWEVTAFEAGYDLVIPEYIDA
ncbi:MAG: leucine-rich repeat protein [Clostridia bacterium]|nr:leucine-rich repeat protein [Clostridia bacterium]